MTVLVDTSVWSLALRRNNDNDSSVAAELLALIQDHRAEIIGPIRQEILSGIKTAKQFDQLRERLTAFPDIPIQTEDYVIAARFLNLCRSKGIQGSNTDFLICAIAARKTMRIFTTDNDFVLFAKHLPIVLHKPETVGLRS